jgi:hypothetical protein
MHNQSNIPGGAAEAPIHGLATPLARRSFLRYSGASLAVGGLLLAGCSDDDDNVDPNSGLIDVGSGDTGILNYAYALEQLEAAFYAQVVAAGSGTYFNNSSTSNAEKAIFSDLRDHEAIHAAFFKAAITSGRITDSLVPDFSSIDFTQRTTPAGSAKLGVLQAAMAFEDLGVAAYNGAGRFISSNDYLTLAGKIVSVEARHAAVIRELLGVRFVANDVVNLDTSTTNNGAPGAAGAVIGTGLERSKRPPVVLETANKFLATGSKLSAKNFA